MAGSVAAVGLVATVAVLTVGLSVAGSAAVVGQRLASAADAAVLAAADAASGAVAGVPCERATEVAGTFGASVALCEVDGLVATVAVSMRFGAHPATASARAGPPAPADPHREHTGK
jgi:secretion/DNA translocation related TadE-like protein